MIDVLLSHMANKTDLNRIFHALADSTRRGVLDRLSHGPMPVTALAVPFDMALPSFLKHLRVLEDAGLILTRKDGRKRWCALIPERMEEVAEWTGTSSALWQSRLEHYRQAMEDDDA